MTKEHQIKSVKIQVITEYEDDTVRETTYTYDHINISWQRGIKRYCCNGRTDRIEPNGQGLLEITAWKGCATPEAFVAEEEITIPQE